MNTIIEKIRAEVERRIKKYREGGFGCHANSLEGLLSFLDTLESEKPIDIDFEQELYKHFGQVKDFTLGMRIGKYFYELGKQEKPTTAEGLEEEIQNQIYNHFFDLHGIAITGTTAYASVEDMVYIARHFAQWGAEHLDK